VDEHARAAQEHRADELGGRPVSTQARLQDISYVHRQSVYDVLVQTRSRTQRETCRDGNI